jgi:hypothetical protein
LKLLLNGGLYRYRSGRKEIVGVQTMGAFLPGWRWHWPGLEVTVFAGLDAQDHRYLPDDRTNRLRGTRLGVRGGFDVWYEPFQDAMLTASASLSTVGKSFWTRVATGWRFFETIWLGPEVLASGDDRYRQLRGDGQRPTKQRLWPLRHDLPAVLWADAVREAPAVLAACYAGLIPLRPCAWGRTGPATSRAFSVCFGKYRS